MSLDDRINDACHRIEELYYETDGKCYISFSGGKDSTALLALTKMCEELYTIPEGAIPAVFCDTGFELRATVQFVQWVKKNWYSNVEIIRPPKPFALVLRDYGKPIKSKIKAEYLGRWQKGTRSDNVMSYLVEGIDRKTGKRYTRTALADKDFHMLHPDFPIQVSGKCCMYLKKKPNKQYSKQHGMKGCAIGIREIEGGARQIAIMKRLKNGGKLCTSYIGDDMQKYPLIDWSNEEVDQFVKRYGIPLSRAYTEYGLNRTGCSACPFALSIDRALTTLYEHEPIMYKASMKLLKDVYIAQNVILPFDESYERERERIWREVYEPMRQEMLRKYRPHSRLIRDYSQTNIFDFMEDE